MGKVSYAPGIEFVQGSLAKPKKVDGHSHGDYLIGTHRTAATQNPNCTRLYIRKANTYGQNVSMSSRSLAARTRFSEVQAAVNERVKDLSKIAQDRQAFLEQKDTAGGKKTMRAYLWKVCGDAYDTAHSNG
jgi:hypothetical protein